MDRCLVFPLFLTLLPDMLSIGGRTFELGDPPYLALMHARDAYAGKRRGRTLGRTVREQGHTSPHISGGMDQRCVWPSWGAKGRREGIHPTLRSEEQLVCLNQVDFGSIEWRSIWF